MATKRRPLRSSSSTMNFRPSVPEPKRNETRGTRPAASPTSVREIFVMMVMHVCKKIIFFDTNLKVALYLGSLFLISLIGDFIPFPKSYLARSDNLFNVYFVKIGWGWTLIFCVPFVIMTHYTLCCGNMRQCLRQHLPRLFIATFFWFFWTKVFNMIETTYGRCTTKGFNSKSSCLKAGHSWHGFDISGHAFILIHSSLVLIEEARPICKWESIKEFIRNELHDRQVDEYSSSNPLRNLNNEQLHNLKFLYERLTPIIRTLFIGMAALQLLWDVMLVGTMLYYHHMVEKVISGIIAILTWYFTYRFWYRSNIFPVPAGSGCFFYQRENKDFIMNNNDSTGKRYNLGTDMRNNSRNASTSRDAPSTSSTSGFGSAQSTSNSQNIRTFIGMPIYLSPRSNSSNSSVNNSSPNATAPTTLVGS